YMDKLETLDISNTDIDSGLEYLPDNLKTINIYGSKGRCQKIANELGGISKVKKNDKLEEELKRLRVEIENLKGQIEVPPKGSD
ncbi:3078_t:CDS:2, partial [Ambispora gerdemannii]